ncbi:hypothetical protein R3W88_005809 [Solanum pinnatisectum]|uniref:Uncharacterized protein n=1 Tax=Solanum pinnatisectum TaxID=50273 RepID=A0AAV9KCY3_9SOLN|nr:hypothetical protein R3W88_005809 [Solanum pinnatisectum]
MIPLSLEIFTKQNCVSDTVKTTCYMISRVHQGVMRVIHQGLKDHQATRRGDGGIKTLKDSSCGGGAGAGGGGGSSSRQTWKLSGAVDTNALIKAAKAKKIKQAEESFRTVMFLTCWGP